MSAEQATINRIVDDPDSGFVCVQVAPMGGNWSALLFMASDENYFDTVSMVFVLEDFSAATAEMDFQTDDWLMSLTHGARSDLSALEATTWVRDRADAVWGREQVTKHDMNRIWTAPDGRQFLVGNKGRSLMRKTGGAWGELTIGRSEKLLDIHGDDDRGIYCCGSGGTLQRLEGGGWVPIELHGDYWLRGLDIAQNGVIRLAGREGTCLEVRNEGEIVVLDAPKNEFFAVREYRGAYYWGDEFGVHKQDETVLVPFFNTLFAYDLRTDDDYLYCVGTNSAWRFDGENWKSVTLVYDETGGFRLV